MNEDKFYQQEFVKNLAAEMKSMRETMSQGFSGVYSRINDLDAKFDTKLTLHASENNNDFKDVRAKQNFADGRAAGIAGLASVFVSVVMWIISLWINGRN